MSIENEERIIVAAMHDDTALQTVLEAMPESALHDDRCRILLGLMRSLHARGIAVDAATVMEELLRLNKTLEIGGLAWFVELIQHTLAVPVHIHSYLERWREERFRTQIAGVAMKMVSTAQTADSAAEALSLGIAELLALQGGHDVAGTHSTREVLQQAVNAIDYRTQHGKASGVPTGFGRLDTLIGGLRPGNLVIVAGRPGMGKTSFVMNIAEHVARHEAQHSLVVSLEMSPEELGIRLISSTGDVEMDNLMHGTLKAHEKQRMNAAITELRHDRISVDTRARTVALVAAAARRVRSLRGLSLIAVDYIQLMDGEGENRTQQISGISRGLKLLANEMGVPVLALSQLSREVEKRSDKRPVMADLRESGAIEQDADAIIMLYRDDVYHEKPYAKQAEYCGAHAQSGNHGEKKGRAPTQSIAEVIVRKARMGQLGTDYAIFEGHFSRFCPCTEPEIIAYRQSRQRPARDIDEEQF